MHQMNTVWGLIWKLATKLLKCLDSTKEQQSSIMTTVPLNKTYDQVALEKRISNSALQ